MEATTLRLRFVAKHETWAKSSNTSKMCGRFLLLRKTSKEYHHWVIDYALGGGLAGAPNGAAMKRDSGQGHVWPGSVAKASGYSVSTVSIVLNDTPFVPGRGDPICLDKHAPDLSLLSTRSVAMPNNKVFSTKYSGQNISLPKVAAASATPDTVEAARLLSMKI